MDIEQGISLGSVHAIQFDDRKHGKIRDPFASLATSVLFCMYAMLGLHLLG